MAKYVAKVVEVADVICVSVCKLIGHRHLTILHRSCSVICSGPTHASVIIYKGTSVL